MTRVCPAFAAELLEHLRGYAVVGLASDGRIVQWLGDSASITGYSEAEAVGRHIRLLYTAADRAAAAPEDEIAKALETGRAEDSRWHCSRGGKRFWANGMSLPFRHEETAVIKIFRDETALKVAEEQRVLLLNELNHRVKNTLATVQSVIEQTLRGAGVAAEVRMDLTGRLLALSRAHNVLVQQNWAGADLAALVNDVIAPYRGEAARFHLDGPLVRLHPSQAVTLSLVLHELATNAVKYGALGVAGGEVHLGWNLSLDACGRRSLTLLWREAGGPPVRPPTRKGFGSRLLRSAFSDQRGEARVEFEPAGVRCLITLGLVETEPPEPGAAADLVAAG
jgi:PAS domain S-box-containing protein